MFLASLSLLQGPKWAPRSLQQNWSHSGSPPSFSASSYPDARRLLRATWPVRKDRGLGEWEWSFSLLLFCFQHKKCVQLPDSTYHGEHLFVQLTPLSALLWVCATAAQRPTRACTPIHHGHTDRSKRMLSAEGREEGKGRKGRGGCRFPRQEGELGNSF